MTRTSTGTFAEYLRPLGPQLPAQLISPPTFESISRTAQVIPGALAMSLFGFECRLADEEPVADFQLCADAAFGARQSLAHAISGGNMLLRNHPVWQRIYDFVDAWSDEASPLNYHLRNIWLEFDIGASTTEMPVPSLFFGLRIGDGNGGGDVRNGHVRLLNDVPAPDAASLPATCLKALTLLTGKPLPPDVACGLTEAIEAVPPSGSVVFVGSMLARNVDAFRLIVEGLDCAGILTYLQRLGWAGSLAEVEAALTRTSRFCDYLWLNVDIGERIYPKIGWECYYHNRVQPHQDTRWEAFLDYLVDEGLCVPSKREGLLAYPRVIGESASGPLWPDSLRLLSRALGPLALRRCVTALHHIKIGYQQGKGVEAKAYLCAHYE
jgi:hypothetical protein